MESKRKPSVYVAIPYSLQDKDKMYEIATLFTVNLLNRGYNVFSPITYSHNMHKTNGVGGSFAYWEDIDKWMISNCDLFVVLKIDGWKRSTGVLAEMAYAEERGKEVCYVTVTEGEHELDFSYYAQPEIQRLLSLPFRMTRPARKESEHHKYISQEAAGHLANVRKRLNEFYTAEMRLRKLQSELFECGTAVSHYMEGKVTTDMLVGEFADVLLLIESISEHYCIEAAVSEKYVEKLLRQEKRMSYEERRK